MSNQTTDVPHVDGQKKIYVAPQLRDLDTTSNTQGKMFPQVAETSTTPTPGGTGPS